MNNSNEDIIKSMVYTRNLLDSISVSGVENCQKIFVACNNIDVFLNMINNNDVKIVRQETDKE